MNVTIGIVFLVGVAVGMVGLYLIARAHVGDLVSRDDDLLERVMRDGAERYAKRRACELCGEMAITRPYGPDGEEVCFPCGMKDPDAAARGFRRRFLS